MKTVLTIIVLLFYGGTAVGYEQPRYEIVKKYKSFEVRQYVPYLVAETAVSGDFDKVGNEAFRILAGYISGNNLKESEIPMTSPVNQSPVLKAGKK